MPLRRRRIREALSQNFFYRNGRKGRKGDWKSKAPFFLASFASFAV